MEVLCIHVVCHLISYHILQLLYWPVIPEQLVLQLLHWCLTGPTSQAVWCSYINFMGAREILYNFMYDFLASKTIPTHPPSTHTHTHTGKQLRVFSLSTKRKKTLSENCAGHFTTNPTQLHLPLCELTTSMADCFPVKVSHETERL